MGCKHNYAYTQGYFYCTKCGRRSDGSRKGNGKKIATVLVSVLFIGVFFVYFGYVEIMPNSEDVDDTLSEIRNNIETSVSEIERQVLNTDVSDVKIPIKTESGFDGRVVEQHIYELTNSEREDVGLSALSRVHIIDSIARDHSQDMSDRDYFEHDSPEGLDPTDRGDRAGYDCRKDYGSYYTYGLAENISYGYTYSSYTVSGVTTSYSWLDGEEDLAREIVTGWMNSPGHRENILDDSYNRIGIGVVINDDEEVYSTQNFC